MVVLGLCGRTVLGWNCGRSSWERGRRFCWLSQEQQHGVASPGMAERRKH